jgi:hypothetical protein
VKQEPQVGNLQGLSAPEFLLPSPGIFFELFLDFLLGLNMTRSGHDFAPLIPLEEAVNDGMVKGMSHEIFQSLFDLGCSRYVPGFSPLEKRSQEEAFLFFAHMLVSPSS